jgi:predicted RNase H-like nuclease (RuvC/YqgF family)
MYVVQPHDDDAVSSELDLLIGVDTQKCKHLERIETYVDYDVREVEHNVENIDKNETRNYHVSRCASDDQKNIKRLLKNRVSAQLSRNRKKHNEKKKESTLEQQEKQIKDFKETIQEQGTTIKELEAKIQQQASELFELQRRGVSRESSDLFEKEDI